MLKEGRTKKSEEYSLVFERKDADLLKFDITVFAADQDADNDWIRDPQGMVYFFIGASYYNNYFANYRKSKPRINSPLCNKCGPL